MDVLSEKLGDVMVITLNRPDARNGMTPEMVAGILDAFKSAEASDVRVIVTRAEGKTFCVGADAGYLGAMMDVTVEEQFWDRWEGRQGLPSLGGRAARMLDPLGFNRWAWEIAQIRVPSIAVIGGAAAGGGLSFALLHHFRFAGRNAKFTTAFGKLALGPELGCSFLLPEIVGRQPALDMFTTSRVLDASRALEIGLIDRLCEPDELLHSAMAYAEEICATPLLAARAGVEAITRSRNSQLLAAMEHEWSRQKSLWGTIEFKQAVSNLVKSKVKV